MIVVDKNWDRWCIASLRVFFNTRKQGLTLFMTSRQEKKGLSTWAEFRVDGPYMKEVGEMIRTFVVNVLVSADYDNPDQDLIYKSVGIIQTIFVNDIPVFKLGNGPDDRPNEQFGCLTREGEVRTTHYGQFDKTVPLTQSVVEASYVIRLG